MQILKRAANRSLDALFAGGVLDGFWTDRLNGRAVCFCYHRVDDPSNHAFLTDTGYPATRPEELEADIRFLQKRGFGIITFEDWRKKGVLDPKRPHAILTFDDCFKDNYANGAEVLRRTGERAVFFQVSSMMDSKELLWEQFVFWSCHDPARSERFTKLVRETIPDEPLIKEKSGLALAFALVEELPFERVHDVMKAAREKPISPEEGRLAAGLYPSRTDVADAARAGHEIGSHGHLHYKRSNVTASMFEEDLRRSVDELRAVSGRAPLSYAYPHGNFTGGDDAVCAKYFKYAVTVDHGVIDEAANPLRLPRFYWSRSPKSELSRRRWLLTGRM
jgi:peptidoglycan/xylan/chitin deacetylase (PgdA/CDA1 family)